MKNTTHIITFLLITPYLITSCDYIIKKEKENIENKQSIANDKLEADLLLIATQQNLNTIALCEAIEKTNADDTLKNVASKIKQEQIKIYNSLQFIANENMILVANTPRPVSQNILFIDNNNLNADDFSNQIQKNLDVQKEVLDSLVKESDDPMMLFVAEENITKLKSNIEISELTLESLK